MSDHPLASVHARLDELATLDPEVLPESTSPIFAFRYIDISSVSTGRIHMPSELTSFADAPSRARMVVRTGDVLMSTVRPGLRAIARYVGDDENVVASTGFAVLRARECADGQFLFNALLSDEVSAQVEQAAVGSNYPAINGRDVKRLTVPKFPLRTQERIAAILTGLDNSVEATEALIEKHQQIKAGLMRDLFTRGVLPNGELRQTCESEPTAYRSTRLGPTPKAWVEKRCSELCSRICVGIVIQPAQYYTAEGVPALRSANVRENEIDLSGLVRISATSNQLLSKSQLRAGDIVTVRTGYPGTSAVVPQTLAGANCIDILISSPGPGVDSTFLSYWLNSSFGKGQVLRKQGGLAQQHFNVGDMRELLVLVPDLEEQLRIRDRLAAADDRLRTEQHRLDKLRLQKLGLMQDLLTCKVRVPLPDPEVTA